MIIGTGVDITEIARIETLIKKQGKRFIDRCFTKQEILRAEKAKTPAGRTSTYAKRWAAKEACAKALGEGIDRGIYLKDIGVVNGTSGSPKLVLTGGALKQLKKITPKSKSAHIDLSLSDDGGFAIAFVIISAKALRKK